jgi:hypothetical protein
MYEIEMHEMSEEFLHCWQAAGIHLSNQVEGGMNSWLRNHPYPPFREHLSFRLGNQLFFIRVEDVEGKVHGPGNSIGFKEAAKNANGHACLMPMKKSAINGEWETAVPNWGLLDAQSNKPIYPFELVTDKKIEMTSWEIHGMAVQVVRDYLEKEQIEVTNWQGTPEVDPSIWFLGKNKKLEWVVVRAVRFPVDVADRPSNWNDIALGVSKTGPIGHFASVAIVSADQPFESMDEEPVPLWRGHGMHIRFTGLE